MSWEVVGIVSKKQCGGAVRRVLLLTLASTCGNDGRDIYASVAQLGRDSEVDPRTVQRTIKDFVSEGLLELIGERKCPRGYTNEYRLVMSAIHSLPNILRREDIEPDHPRRAATRGSTPPRQPVTPDRTPPLTERHPSKAKAPVASGDFASDPRQPVTRGDAPPPAESHPTLFPSNSKNLSVESSVVAASELLPDEQRAIPKNWTPKPELRRRALEDLLFTQEEYNDALAEFIDYWARRARTKDGKKAERGWNAAFGSRLNDLAARWRTQYRRNAQRGSQPQSVGQHRSSSLASPAARMQHLREDEADVSERPDWVA